MGELRLEDQPEVLGRVRATVDRITEEDDRRVRSKVAGEYTFGCI